jgi:hypothetical protein
MVGNAIRVFINLAVNVKELQCQKMQVWMYKAVVGDVMMDLRELITRIQ